MKKTQKTQSTPYDRYNKEADHDNKSYQAGPFFSKVQKCISNNPNTIAFKSFLNAKIILMNIKQEVTERNNQCIIK